MCNSISHCLSSTFNQCLLFCPLAGRCYKLGWRDYVMATGLVFTITGLVISLLEGLSLYAGLFAIGTIGLFLGTYLINRVKELETMESSLASLQTKIVHLERINQNLAISVATFKTQLHEQKEQIKTLQGENARYKELNEHLGRTAERYEKLRRDIQDSSEKFPPLAKEFLERSEELTKIKEDYVRLQKEFEAHLHANHAKLQASTEHLQQVERQLQATLQQGAEKLQNLFDCLQAVASSLQSSAEKIDRSLPTYSALAARIKSCLDETKIFQDRLLEA